jgi:hypothetical protein
MKCLHFASNGFTEVHFTLTGAFAFAGFEPQVAYEHDFGGLALYVQVNVPYDAVANRWGLEPLIGIEYSF